MVGFIGTELPFFWVIGYLCCVIQNFRPCAFYSSYPLPILSDIYMSDNDLVLRRVILSLPGSDDFLTFLLAEGLWSNYLPCYLLHNA